MVRGILEDVLELSVLGTFVCAIAMVARTWAGA